MRYRFVGCSTALVLGLCISGCREEPARRRVAELDPGSGKGVSLKGELAEGAECPLLVTADGRRFSLGGDLRGFKVGDRVCVRGKAVEASICMAGEATLAIEAIGPEADCPAEAR